MIQDTKNPPLEWHVLYNEVLGLVTALPPRQRAAIQLVYVEGGHYQEAAARLAIPLGTLMSRLARAKAQVGAWLGEDTSPCNRRQMPKNGTEAPAHLG